MAAMTEGEQAAMQAAVKAVAEGVSLHDAAAQYQVGVVELMVTIDVTEPQGVRLDYYVGLT